MYHILSDELVYRTSFCLVAPFRQDRTLCTWSKRSKKEGCLKISWYNFIENETTRWYNTEESLLTNQYRPKLRRREVMRWFIIDNFSLSYQWRLQTVCPERAGKEHPQNKISKQIVLIKIFWLLCILSISELPYVNTG